MFPLRCTVASEIFSKSSMGNPIENFFIGEIIFPPTLQLLHSPPVPTPLTRKHTSATENFSIGEQEEGVGEIADPAAGELLSGPDDVFSPIRCRLRVFFFF